MLFFLDTDECSVSPSVCDINANGRCKLIRGTKKKNKVEKRNLKQKLLLDRNEYSLCHIIRG